MSKSPDKKKKFSVYSERNKSYYIFIEPRIGRKKKEIAKKKESWYKAAVPWKNDLSPNF